MPSGLANPPIDGRYAHSAVWTGTEMIIWGGLAGPNEQPSADGAAYDPQGDSWRVLSLGPLEPRFAHSAVWTGQEMIIWGGTRAEEEEPLADGAAYDPSADTWRSLSPSPGSGRSFHSAVWTGSEMLMWGGRTAAGEAEGLAFDPVQDTWRSISPFGQQRESHTAVWTGELMLIWGGRTSGTANLNADGMSYEPTNDNWNPIGPAPLRERFGHSAIWTGTDMFVWGGSAAEHNAFADGASYDASARLSNWAPLPPAPLVGRFGHSAVWTGAEMLIWGGRTGYGREPLARGVAYDPSTDRWRGQVDAEEPDSQAPATDDSGLIEPRSSPIPVTLVDCRGLLLPPIGFDLDMSLNVEDEVLDIYYDYGATSVRVRVQYLDPACLTHPMIGPIIQDVLTEHFEDLATECAALRARMESGELVVRGRPQDPEAVRAYIDRWCPAE